MQGIGSNLNTKHTLTQQYRPCQMQPQQHHLLQIYTMPQATYDAQQDGNDRATYQVACQFSTGHMRPIALMQNRPARVKAKLGKGPDGVGNVLGVELGDEVQAQVCRPLQERFRRGVAYGGHSPQCVLDSLRREGVQLLKRHCRYCCQKLPPYTCSFQCASLLVRLLTDESCTLTACHLALTAAQSMFKQVMLGLCL